MERSLAKKTTLSALFLGIAASFFMDYHAIRTGVLVKERVSRDSYIVSNTLDNAVNYAFDLNSLNIRQIATDVRTFSRSYPAGTAKTGGKVLALADSLEGLSYQLADQEIYGSGNQEELQKSVRGKLREYAPAFRTCAENIAQKEYSSKRTTGLIAAGIPTVLDAIAFFLLVWLRRKEKED